MKVKIHFPFVYFLIESNIVAVYKIKSLEYVNLTDVINIDEWEAYELQHSHQFEVFNHDKSRPSENLWSFYLEQEQLYTIVEIINDAIQQQRTASHYESIMPSSQMVHIACSESAAGSLRVALVSTRHIIAFSDDLSIGPVCQLEAKLGQAFRKEWLYENINDEQDDHGEYNKFVNTLREIDDIPIHIPIYIWVGNNANEQCLLRFFLYLLNNKVNEIYLMQTSEHNKYGYTGHLSSLQLSQLFMNSENKPLTIQERRSLQKEWKHLSQTRNVLRRWVNGEIISVSEDYFDALIINTITKLHKEQTMKDFIKTGIVIAELISQMDECPNLFYLEYRIRFLVYNGVLALKGIPKSMRHYSVKLRD
ncbi:MULTISPECIES: DUF1835 domain-containing protein [Lysinibacillus]|uniref:DUF1835 domain-containing protein n=1 Tax=Lysinibacillus TaxID=400634 RepID=UPI00257D99E1|nr:MULTISPECIES: DUF1835 domain-containing protein [Lysinibacillus]